MGVIRGRNRREETTAGQGLGKPKGKKGKGKGKARKNGAATPGDSSDTDDQPLTEVVESADQAASTAAAVPVAAPEGCEPVFALASEELLSSVRVGTLDAPPAYEAVRSALMALEESDDDGLQKFVQSNRDLLDYRFLYRLTADKLRAENTGSPEQAATFQAARVRVVRACQAFDRPLFVEVTYSVANLSPAPSPSPSPSPPPARSPLSSPSLAKVRQPAAQRRQPAGAEAEPEPTTQVTNAEGRLGGLLARYMQGREPTAEEVVAAAGSTPQLPLSPTTY